MFFFEGINFKFYFILYQMLPFWERFFRLTLCFTPGKWTLIEGMKKNTFSPASVKLIFLCSHYFGLLQIIFPNLLFLMIVRSLFKMWPWYLSTKGDWSQLHNIVGSARNWSTSQSATNLLKMNILEQMGAARS